MLYSPTRNIDDRVVELLAEGRLTVKSICSTLGEGERVSLRGVYKAVNNLVEDGVLIKVGRWVMLSEEWTRLVAERLASPAAPAIGEGERLSYIFTSLDHLDALWKSTVLPLERVTQAREVFIYNPHSFWALLPERTASEARFFEHFGPAQQGFLTIGGESVADLALKRQYQTEYLQINLGNIGSIRRTDHITVLGSYIILTRLSKSLADRMDALYASDRPLDELVSELLMLCARPGRLRLIIDNNPKKAAKLRRMLARNFYFRKSE